EGGERGRGDGGRGEGGGKAGDRHARTSHDGPGPVERPATAAGPRTEPVAGEVPDRPRPVRVGGQDRERGGAAPRPPARDRSEPAGQGAGAAGQAAPPTRPDRLRRRVGAGGGAE